MNLVIILLAYFFLFSVVYAVASFLLLTYEKDYSRSKIKLLFFLNTLTAIAWTAVLAFPAENQRLVFTFIFIPSVIIKAAWYSYKETSLSFNAMLGVFLLIEVFVMITVGILDMLIRI
ncbi:hypothetical protein AAIR98_000503 [Elusimicrobium simillimum]|uniref:hypothetical protein n=1 Tax=Elusimicrobium simillimum TaxID=3143438 RepID=UPI003C705AA7